MPSPSETSWPTGMTSLGDFARSQAQLLAQERREELDRSSDLLAGLSPRDLALRGLCLRNLCLGSRRTGLYGRVVLELVPGDGGGAKKDLPAHDITVGDICGLFHSTADDSAQVSSGVVTSVASSGISVSFDADGGDSSTSVSELPDSDRYRIVKLANDVTYRRLKV